MATKLHQIIAIESGIKADANREKTDIYRDVQRPALINGLSRTYQRRNDEGDELPDEGTQVQLNVEDALKRLGDTLTRLFDVEFTKDMANTRAVADVTLRGETEPLIVGAPTTFLLFLEKQLTDVSTFIKALPTLDPSEVWHHDDNIGVFVSEEAKTTRTKKTPTVITKAPATDKHPAQTEMFMEDVIVGDWTIRKYSGAIQAPRKEELLRRINRLIEAVKFAREEANGIEIEDMAAGQAIFDYLLAP